MQNKLVQWFLTFLANYPFWCNWKPNYPKKLSKNLSKNISKNLSKNYVKKSVKKIFRKDVKKCIKKSVQKSVKKTNDLFIHKQQHLSIDMKTKKFQHGPRINISIWHKTCDMWHVTCDMQHVTCDIITNTHFWAKTSKQKLFSMTQEST